VRGEYFAMHSLSTYFKDCDASRYSRLLVIRQQENMIIAPPMLKQCLGFGSITISRAAQRCWQKQLSIQTCRDLPKGKHKALNGLHAARLLISCRCADHGSARLPVRQVVDNVTLFAPTGLKSQSQRMITSVHAVFLHTLNLSYSIPERS